MYAIYVALTLLVAPFFIVSDAWKELRHRPGAGRLRGRLGSIEPPPQPALPLDPCGIRGRGAGRRALS